MDELALRVGMLAAYLSAEKRDSRWVGVMITASHNPVQDNGIKLIDCDGAVPPEEWEAIAMEFANGQALVCAGGQVYIGWDTRPSSVPLAGLIAKGVGEAKGRALKGGLMATPKCHYEVRRLNEPAMASYEDYLLRFEPIPSPSTVVDMANGVGAHTGSQILRKTLPGVAFINTGEDGVLNHECGADYVKFNSRPPRNAAMVGGVEYVTFDGDADRVLMFYFADGTSQFKLLDGDKIAALLALYVRREAPQLRIAVVQTAYANGGSTAFLESLGVQLICTQTGVKHLHREAHRVGDVGIYFEANGHGTVLFNSAQAAEALPRLHACCNQLVGDAISDLLMVKLVLRELRMTFSHWDQLYAELPSKQLKVKADRAVFQCTDADRRLLRPAGLQGQIDCAVGKYPSGRAFVRPSGTEDIVRVYAEAETAADADRLAAEVAALLNQSQQ